MVEKEEYLHGSDDQDGVVTFTNNMDQDKDISYNDDSDDEELLSLATNNENNVEDDNDQIQISQKADEEEGI